MSLRPASAQDLADAGAFLTRAVRLEPAALVRLRAAGQGAVVALWAAPPLDVLATRRVAATLDEADATVPAAGLLGALAPDAAAVPLPARRDADWRRALPPERGWRVLSSVPAHDVIRVVRVGMETFRGLAAAAADPGRLGEALLDHQALHVTDGDEKLAVPLRVLQALVRMGFVREGTDVRVSATAGWARLDAAYGTVFRRRGEGLALRPV